MSRFNSQFRLILNSLRILVLITCGFSYELYANRDKSNFIYMEGEKCILFIDKKYASALSGYNYTILPSEKFSHIFQNCFENKYRNSLLKRVFIFPGTYWCGIGTIAKDVEDFGSFKDVDSCCRLHDLCPLSVPTSRCDYNLCNSWINTISHCECDQMFHDCLVRINSTGADIIGTLYFDLLHTNCFYEKQGSPKCPLITNGICKCKTHLKRLNYIRKYQILELPVIKRVKKKFMWYLHKFY